MSDPLSDSDGHCIVRWLRVYGGTRLQFVPLGPRPAELREIVDMSSINIWANPLVPIGALSDSAAHCARVDLMKKVGKIFQLSATDLVGYLNCRRLTALDRAVTDGALPKPKVWDPFLQILSERGKAHEQSYVEHLKKAGLEVVLIEGVEVTDAAAADTLVGMRRGDPVIAQAALTHHGWNGRADILRRVEASSALGGWSYEPIDTKLARETKAGTILQLCVYADLLAAMQGRPPEYMKVVAPRSDFEPCRRDQDDGAFLQRR